SGVAQARRRALHLVDVGCLREQPQGEVLPAHQGWPEARRAGHARVDADHGDPGAFSCAAGRTVVKTLRAYWTGCSWFVRRRTHERLLTEELQSHLQLHIDDNLA